MKICERVAVKQVEDTAMTLPYETRKKYRFIARLDDGVEVGVMLPREGVLRDGDCLRREDGAIVRVKAEDELLSVASSQDPLLLMRACYHLGNRHVALQVGDGWISYQVDHVLDDMVRGLGMSVDQHCAPFEPESGAYDH